MKYRMGNKYWLLAIGFWLIALTGAKAAPMQGIPKRPNPPKLVNNFSTYQILSQDQVDALETKLDAFANSSSNQIAIVMVDSLYDHDLSEFATELGEEWKIGQKKFDNGVVILIQPGAHKVFIAPGYGLGRSNTRCHLRRYCTAGNTPQF